MKKGRTDRQDRHDRHDRHDRQDKTDSGWFGFAVSSVVGLAAERGQFQSVKLRAVVCAVGGDIGGGGCRVD